MHEPKFDTLIVDPEAIPRTATPLSPRMMQLAQLDAFALRVSEGYTYEKTITQTIRGASTRREIWTRPAALSSPQRIGNRPATRLATADFILGTLEAYVNTARDLPLPRGADSKTLRNPHAWRFVETMRMILGWHGNRLTVEIDASKTPIEGHRDALAILALLVEDEIEADSIAWATARDRFTERISASYSLRPWETKIERARRMIPLLLERRRHSLSQPLAGGVPWAIDFAIRLGAFDGVPIPMESVSAEGLIRELANYDEEYESDLVTLLDEIQTELDHEEVDALAARIAAVKRFATAEVSESTLRTYVAALRERPELLARITQLREYVGAWQRAEPPFAGKIVAASDETLPASRPLEHPSTAALLLAELSRQEREAAEEGATRRTSEDADALAAALDFERGG